MIYDRNSVLYTVHVETVCLLSKFNVIGLSIDELNLTADERKAAHNELESPENGI